MYDDDQAEPPDQRLAKYVEYTGSDGEAPDGRPPGKSDGRRAGKTTRRSDGSLTHLIENSRESASERRDGRGGSPGRADHKRPQGEWRSHGSAEDRVDAGHRRSERWSSRTETVARTDRHRKTDEGGSSVSSEEGRHPHSSSTRHGEPSSSQAVRDSSSSPKPASKTKKKGWLSATLSRLDLKSSKSDRAKKRATSSPAQPEARRSQSPTGGGSRQQSPEPRDGARHVAAGRRRRSRSGSRDGLDTSEEHSVTASRRREQRVSTGRRETRSEVTRSGKRRETRAEDRRERRSEERRGASPDDKREVSTEDRRGRRSEGRRERRYEGHREGSEDPRDGRSEDRREASSDDRRERRYESREVSSEHRRERRYEDRRDRRSEERRDRRSEERRDRRSEERRDRRSEERRDRRSEERRETSSEDRRRRSEERRDTRPEDQWEGRSGDRHASRSEESRRRSHNVTSSGRRESHRSSDREGRSGVYEEVRGRGGRTTERHQTSKTTERRPVSRSTSFSRRYPEDAVDGTVRTARSGAGRRTARLSSDASSPRRGQHSVASSLNSSGSELKHPREREINYENRGGQANGRPPRAPQRSPQRRDSHDTELTEPATGRRRQPVSRSSSMPKGSRSAGWYRAEDRPAR
ncbi:zinc finger CCCH domain-containing protein 13-like [Pollicipes pollicipes]|uniref:zinc finger CCCH domain-containing protein 13-like n=1 Tax=Pollicipes pollicipes TaxID=41117 RepID=UPI001884FB1C|nr:zinc finger CCCH domain-containing protein 13-like [Pollicipes pollicipes]